MGGPFWLSAIFAAMMLTVAVYCAGRLAVARRWRRPTEVDTDGAHVVMGVAMAGMLVSSLRTPVPVPLWEAVFAAGVVWFGWRTLRARRAAAAASSPWRCLHAAPHLVECVAMLYMFLLLPVSSVAVRSVAAVRGTAAGMAVMPLSLNASRFSFLALPMALFLLGYAVVLADRLTVPALAFASASHADPPAAAAASVPGRRHLAPRCAVLCKMAMGVTMGYLLILML